MVVGIVFLIAFVRPATSTPGARGWLLLILMSGFYAWGVVAGANTVSDPAPPQTFRVAVIGKNISRGSRHSTFYLHLEPWGPFPQEQLMSVSPSLYERTNSGDIVCVALHAGFLHAPWYEPVTCPASPTDAPMQ
jgi:hypothetical protein